MTKQDDAPLVPGEVVKPTPGKKPFSVNSFMGNKFNKTAPNYQAPMKGKIGRAAARGR